MRRWCSIAMSALSVLTIALSSVTIVGCSKDEAQAIREEETNPQVQNAVRTLGTGRDKQEDLQDLTGE